MKKNLLIVLISVCIVASSLYLLRTNKKEDVNIDNVETILLRQFSDYNLRKLEKEDISNYFGMIMEEDVPYLFLTDFYEDETNPKPFSPNVLIVFINDSNYKEYANTLKDYVDCEIQNTIDQERLKLYNNKTIYEGSTYFYLVIGEDKNLVKVIEEVINQ